MSQLEETSGLPICPNLLVLLRRKLETTGFFQDQGHDRNRGRTWTRSPLLHSRAEQDCMWSPQPGAEGYFSDATHAAPVCIWMAVDASSGTPHPPRFFSLPHPPPTVEFYQNIPNMMLEEQFLFNRKRQSHSLSATRSVFCPQARSRTK